ncbi:phospholipase D-like domain-containing protein [Paenibacillus allorhizosphaerae]|uniref:Major cardiolipin synthase ClsA n=1 Tax=Paenibacillus allorhizosphaerae TaxID=2849866 RepID=A0ABM8VNB6_9BACL|nr:phospholipase D-like domain-containing protein [Paenibacillus allorhizosphaerae]CAG7651078.1 Major cardiolipin synthase ClsA [Paenibacillus allorhizosphaerae]
MAWIVWLYLINTLFMFIVAIREVRRPAKALNWLAILLVFPVIGFGLYLSMTNPVIRREKLTSPRNDSDTLPDSFSHSALVIAHSLRHLAIHGLRKGKVQMLINGIETYERLMESITKAQNTIDLEYYIYRDDQIGRRFTELLIERANAGVRVRFVRDGWGSRKFPRSQIARMMDAGIDCRTFFPMRFPWVLSYWNYRDHCKIVVVDGQEAFTGGINIGYEYTGLKPNKGFWRDTHMRVTGETAVDLRDVFKAHWNMGAPERINLMTRKHQEKTLKPIEQSTSNSIAPQSMTASVSGLSAEWAAELGTLDDEGSGSESEKLFDAYVQSFEGNPGLPTQVVREVYFICITQCRQTLDITTPYFIPDADIIMALKTAAARGVRVRLLVPRQSDQKIVDLASRTYFGELLEAGVQIYQYNNGMLHAKVMIMDGEIAEVGAANYDMRSFRLNYEVCEVIYSTDIASQLTAQFERDLMDSVPLHIENLLQRSFPQRIMEQGARLLSPMI